MNGRKFTTQQKSSLVTTPEKKPQEKPKIDFSNKKLGMTGAIAAARKLASGSYKHLHGLTIDFSGNDIGSDGAKAFADALKSNNCPQGLRLYLQKNNIGNNGAEILANAFASSNCPQELVVILSHNNINNAGAEKIISTLESSVCAQGLEFGLSNNKINNMLLEKIHCLLRTSEMRHTALSCVTFQQGIRQQQSTLAKLPADTVEIINTFIYPGYHSSERDKDDHFLTHCKCYFISPEHSNSRYPL